VISADDVERMDLEERLRAMELLWDSLSRTPAAVPSPDWHGEIVAERLAKVERGEGNFLTLAEAKARLLKTKE